MRAPASFRSTPRRNDIIVRISCVSYASYLEMDDIDLEERIELVPSSASKTRWSQEHGEESKDGRWAERKRSFEANLHSFPRWEGDEGLTMGEVQRFRTRGPVSRSFRVAEGADAPPPRERRAFVFRLDLRAPRRYRFVRREAPASFKASLVCGILVLSILAIWGQLLLKPLPVPTQAPTAAPHARGAVIYRERGHRPGRDKRRPTPNPRVAA